MKLFNNRNIYREEFDDNQFEGQGSESEYHYELPEDSADYQEQQLEHQQAPPTRQVDLDTLREIHSLYSNPQRPAQQPAQEPQLTQAEIDARLKVFRPDLRMAQRLFGEDANQEHVDVLQEMTNGIVEHLSTVMGYANQSMRQEFTQTYNPALELVREQKRTEFTSQLTSAYPSLRGKEIAVRRVIDDLQARGYKPTDGNEAARVVAAEVESLIRTADPTFSLAQQPAQRQQTVRMPSLASGSGGGGGSTSGSSNGKKPQKSWEGLFARS